MIEVRAGEEWLRWDKGGVTGTPAPLAVVQRLVKDALPVRPTPTSLAKPATLSGPALQIEATLIEALSDFGVPVVKTNTEKLPKLKSYPADVTL